MRNWQAQQRIEGNVGIGLGPIALVVACVPLVWLIEVAGVFSAVDFLITM